MKNSTKIWIALTGILLIILGCFCIARPAGTIFATAWVIGIFTLCSGISELVFTIKTQDTIPNSGTRMLSAILQILIGCIFLSNEVLLAVSLPIVFALWVIIDGVIVAVKSFDYKQVGFGYWWCILILGIAAVVLGFLGLKNPVATGKTLAVLIGLAVILTGCAYLVALRGINRLQKRVSSAREAIREFIEEQ